jgi:endonuclease YncB( thermonuclease family)
MSRILIGLFALALIGCHSALFVTEVISGDTIRLSDGTIVKYAFVKAPSSGEPLFEVCREENRRLVGGREVQIFPEDSLSSDEVYGYVFFSVEPEPEEKRYCFVNAELLLNGYGKVNPDPTKATRQDLVGNLITAQKVAKELQLGVWKPPK